MALFRKSGEGQPGQQFPVETLVAAVEEANRMRDVAVALMHTDSARDLVEFMSNLVFLGCLDDLQRAGKIPSTDEAIKAYLAEGDNKLAS